MTTLMLKYFKKIDENILYFAKQVVNCTTIKTNKMAKQYIGSQQHWEDSINSDYDYKQRMDKEMEKQIYRQINDQFNESTMSNELKIINILTNWLIINGESEADDTVKVEKEMFEIWPDIYQIKKTMYHLNSMSVTRDKIERYVKSLNIK